MVIMVRQVCYWLRRALQVEEVKIPVGKFDYNETKDCLLKIILLDSLTNHLNDLLALNRIFCNLEVKCFEFYPNC